jgi:nucleoside-diphosphate-sugar epimerase
MIVGNGMMARAFSSYETSSDILVFASGVSNSRETSETAFKRETDLLKEWLSKVNAETFIYFSTCSIYDPTLKETPYVNHKMRMEEIVRFNAERYLIFRLPQVVGKTVNRTLINTLFNMIQSGQQFEVWTSAYRNIVDCEDVFKVCRYVLENKIFLNRTINIASTTKVAVPRIVEIMEIILNKKANVSPVDKGGDYDICLADIQTVFEALGMEFDEQYPERVIRKYYEADVK